ncbi:hypothetical protein AC578_2320 [Pseudocercospora eumusae]|uniref:Uncharacterized protein n=1 Tax=Pseudocercospora eumusae TaxID=321146 RepID=A0A139HXL0_9PEZI|nr:hypothetical protein AC578_2320 [Pseudocercospora eumusae]
MDKLKKVFSPGAPKDDEVLYGDPEARRASAGKQPEQQPETLHPTEQADKKDKGILRQIMNPGGDKYDDQRYGTTATTDEPDPNKLQTDSDQKDYSIMRQLKNPAGHKYDEQAYGITAATAGDRKSSVPTTTTQGTIDPNEKLETNKDQKEHSILRQIINPHGKKYDNEGYGQTAHEAGQSSSGQKAAAAAVEDDSSKPLPLMRPDQNLVADKQVESSRAEPTQSQTQSNLGRDAAIAGGASAVGGGAAYAATRDRDEANRANTTSGGTSSVQDQTGRGFGYDQSAQSASATAPAAPSTAGQPAALSAIGRDSQIGTSVQDQTGRGFGYDQSAQSASATAPAAPSTTGQPAALSALGRENPTNTQTSDSSHLGRDAAIAGGVGAMGAGGAYAATRDRNHKEDGAIAGTDLSPVGSGFLGSRDHNTTSSTTGFSTLGASGQTDGLADGRSAERAAGEQSGQHNYGRDATLASGLAAGGALGAHEANKHREQQGDNFIAATGTAPISRPLDGDSNIATGRTVERSGTSNLPNEASRLESSTGSGITGSSINPVGAPETAYAGAGHLGSTGTTAGSGFTEQRGAGSTGLGSSATAGGIQSSSAPGHGHINPVGAPEESLAGGHHHGVVGAGVHNDTGSEQLNQAPADVQAATYTYSSQPVGSTFAPHVPGEFPSEAGQDPHETSRSYGATAGGSQVAPLASGTAAGLATGAVAGTALGARDTPSTMGTPQQNSSIPVGGSAASTQPTTQDYPIRSAMNQTVPTSAETQQHNYGRNMGIAGGALGAGALGAGAYEATQGRDHAPPTQQMPPSSTTQSASQPASQLPPPRQENHPSTHQAATTTTTTQPTTQQRMHQETLAQKEESHHGRDAALAGGAGAAYAATRDRNDTGPAPNTIGPHDSDVKNVLDPRVKPDTAVQGSQKNRDPATAAAQKASKDHQYETRDAALATGAAGAAAGAAAAYGTTHDVYGEEDPNKHNKLHKPTPDEKKHDKELEKEQKKHEKEAEKEHKKAEREAEKEQKKAEKEAEKEHAKAEKQAEKDHKKAEKEAEKEKKPSLLDRILHPGRHDGKETEYVSNDKTGHNKGDLNHPLVGAAEAEQAERQAHRAPPEGTVIEPSSGLPANVGKYGDGHGGTDGAPQIEGYHESDPALRNATVGTGQGAGTQAGHAQPGQEGVAGPDWDAIKKANTPY